MPELPEVECVRRTLARHIVGRRVVSVRVSRRDVVRGGSKPRDLLAGDEVVDIRRKGKQIALMGRGRCLAVHLGMSGQLCVVPTKERTNGGKGSRLANDLPAHTHVLWQFEDGLAVRFTDPRRFGGVWSFNRFETLQAQRWSKLGPDALAIKPADLARRLSRTQRCLKAALLDQSLVAGLGNIYVDELLFAARLSPYMPANTLTAKHSRDLVQRMRRLLAQSIQRGGSTLRDYVNADNAAGSQQSHHRVYGRAGLVCKRRGCGQAIQSSQIAGRTTAWCPACQG